MAVIAKITSQQKNKARYNIFIDQGDGEEYWTSVGEDVLVLFHLRKGLEINKEEIERIIYEETIRKAYNKAIHFLSFRIRSEKEVREYLTKKEIDHTVIPVVIKRLLKEKYISDSAFADAFVRTRIELSLKGPEFIKRELMDKGISDEIISESIKIFTYEKQIEKVNKLIEKKKKKNKFTSSQEQIRKLIAMINQQGFVYEVVKEAIAKLFERSEVNDVDDWDAIIYQGEKAYKKYKQIEGWEKKQKIKQFLFRRGFTIDLIERFLTEYEEEKG